MMKTNRGRDKFYKYEKLINILANCIGFFPFKFRLFLYQILRNTNGNIGIGLRYTILKTIVNKCGRNVSIGPNVYIFHPENLTLGDNVSIHPMSYIDAAGEIEIGNDVSIATSTTILSSSHNYNDHQVPIKDQGLSFSKTTIQDNVWIGAKVTILYGIMIESGSIVGANSVVTRSISKNSVAVGSPAKIVRKR